MQRDDVKIRVTHQIERYKLLLLFVKCAKLGKKEVEVICGRLDDTKASHLRRACAELCECTFCVVM